MRHTASSQAVNFIVFLSNQTKEEEKENNWRARYQPDSFCFWHTWHTWLFVPCIIFCAKNVVLGFNHKVPTLHRSRKCVFHVSACFSLFYLLGCQVCLCSLLYSSSKPNMCTLLLCVGRFDDYNLLFSMITLEFVQTPCFNFFIPA